MTPTIVRYDMGSLTDEQFHEIRRSGIGGSDIAAALGLSKWKTPWALYHSKRGEIAPVSYTHLTLPTNREV